MDNTWSEIRFQGDLMQEGAHCAYIITTNLPYVTASWVTHIR